MTRRSSRLARLTVVVVGVGLGIGFFVRLGPHAVGAQLSRVGPGIVWLVLPYALGTAVGAIPWALLLPRSAQPGWLAVIAGRFAASGANALLPFFGLAGEPSRLMWLAPPDRARGTAAIVVDRVIYNEAGALLLLAGGVLGYLATPLPPVLCAAAIAIAVALIVGSLGVLYAAARWGVGRRLGAWKHAEFATLVDTALHTVLREGPRPIIVGLAIHLAGRVLLAVEVYVVLWVLGGDATLVNSLVIATVPVATGLVASTIPSQIGVQEAAQTLIFGALGMEPALGFTFVLIQRVRQLLFAPLTPVLLGVAHAPATAAASGTPPATTT
jgi:hypothetical protein